MAISTMQTQPTGLSFVGTLRAEVQDFLNQFADALTTGDGETVATLWETPALVIARDGVMDLDSPRQIAQWFGLARRHIGLPDLVDLERIDDRIVVASIRWETAEGPEASDYTLRRNDRGELKLRSVLMRGIAI